MERSTVFKIHCDSYCSHADSDHEDEDDEDHDHEDGKKFVFHEAEQVCIDECR